MEMKVFDEKHSPSSFGHNGEDVNASHNVYGHGSITLNPKLSLHP